MEQWWTFPRVAGRQKLPQEHSDESSKRSQRNPQQHLKNCRARWPQLRSALMTQPSEGDEAEMASKDKTTADQKQQKGSSHFCQKTSWRKPRVLGKYFVYWRNNSWTALSCWNTRGLPWNRCHLEGSICCSKTFTYHSYFLPKHASCPDCTPTPSEMLAYILIADNTVEGLPPL